MYHCVSWRCAVCWFDTFIHTADDCVSWHLSQVTLLPILFCGENIRKPLSDFQVYNTVLTIITLLFIRFPELLHLRAKSLYSLTNSLIPFPPAQCPGDCHWGLCFSAFTVFRFYMNVIACSICLLWRTSLSLSVLKVHPCCGKWQRVLLFEFSSVAQSCLILCHPMDCSTPGLPVCHQLSELAQTHVHRVSDAIQLSHPLLSPSPPALNLSQHQGLFTWVSSSHQAAKVLEFQLQHQSFQ